MDKRVYFVGKPPFEDWLESIKAQPLVGYIPNVKTLTDERIIPISPEQHLLNGSIFRPVPEELKNKATFAIFMEQYYPEFIPRTVWNPLDIENKAHELLRKSPGTPTIQYIVKPLIGSSGAGISVINHPSMIKMLKSNVIISEYIDHDRYWVGHFLVLDGKILYRVFFTNTFSSGVSKSTGSLATGERRKRAEIKRGPIRNYTVDTHLDFDQSIFDQIFEKLSYSGITCIDFTVRYRKPVIFELNTRPGGSLLKNDKCFAQMLQVLNEHSQGSQ